MQCRQSSAGGLSVECVCERERERERGKAVFEIFHNGGSRASPVCWVGVRGMRFRV